MGLGDRIRQERIAHGWTQKQLEQESGCKQQMISKLERGESQMTSDIVSLARALDVTPEWLLTGHGPKDMSAWLRHEISLLPIQEQAAFAAEIHRRLAESQQVPAEPVVSDQ